MNFQHARRRCSRERSRPSAADEEAGGRPSTISAGASDEINEFLVGCAAAILARANGSACPLQVVTVSKVFKVDRPPPRPRGSFPLFTYRVGPPSVVRVSDAYLFRANQARRCHDRSRDGDARDDPKNAICRSVCPHLNRSHPPVSTMIHLRPPTARSNAMSTCSAVEMSTRRARYRRLSMQSPVALHWAHRKTGSRDPNERGASERRQEPFQENGVLDRARFHRLQLHHP